MWAHHLTSCQTAVTAGGQDESRGELTSEQYGRFNHDCISVLWQYSPFCSSLQWKQVILFKVVSYFLFRPRLMYLHNWYIKPVLTEHTQISGFGNT